MSIINNATYLSSLIPEHTYTSNGYAFSDVTFHVAVGGVSVSKATILYDPDSCSATFRPKDIICRYMRNNAIPYAEITITAKTPGTDNILQIRNFKVVYAENAPDIAIDDFLRDNFLNDFKVMRVFSGYYGRVSLYDKEPGSVSFHAIAAEEDTPRLLKTTEHNGGAVTIPFFIPDILAEAIEAGVIDREYRPAKIMISAGNRLLELFISGQRPSAQMIFLDSFNHSECYQFFGTYKLDGKQSADTALISGKRHPVSISREQKIELSDNCLDISQYHAMQGLVSNRAVDLSLFQGRSATLFRAIITEVDSSFSSNSDELGTLKITMTPEQDLGTMANTSGNSTNIFTNTFNNSFQ